MKYTLIVLLLVANSIGVSAQKNNLFADVGISLEGEKPGLSVTYSRKFAKHFGGGIGLQDYSYTPTFTNRYQYVPAVFGDIRAYFRVRKRNIFFPFLDLGANFYKKNDYYYRNNNLVYQDIRNNGFYGGFGFGYFHRMTKRGGGLYGSLKMITNTYNANRYDLVLNDRHTATWLEGTLALSVGFKF